MSRTTASVLALAAAAFAAGPVHAAGVDGADTAESRDRFAMGLIAAASRPSDNDMLASLGLTFSYAPRAFYSLGGEVSAFALVLPAENYRRSCPTCARSGTMLLPFGEVHTTWTIPVNVFVRFSPGFAIARLNDDSNKVLSHVRVAAGLELRVWHVYAKPFVSIANEISDWQNGPVSFGGEIGAVW